MIKKAKILFLFLPLVFMACNNSSDCTGVISINDPIEDMTVALGDGEIRIDVFDAPAVFTRNVFTDEVIIEASETSGGAVVTVDVVANAQTGDEQVVVITPVAAGETTITIGAIDPCNPTFAITDTFVLTVTQ